MHLNKAIVSLAIVRVVYHFGSVFVRLQSTTSHYVVHIAAARKFGADVVINSKGLDDDELIEQVKELTGGFGPDLVMECSGFPGAISLGVKMLRIGGRLASVGCVVLGWVGSLSNFR